MLNNEVLFDSIEAYERCGGSIQEAARVLGISESALRYRLEKAREKGIGNFKSSTNKKKLEESGRKQHFRIADNSDNSKEIDSVSLTVRTVEDALAKAEIDLEVWEVERSVINSWEVGIKVKEDGRYKVKVSPLWQVKVFLKRRIPKIYHDAMTSLIDRMSSYAPNYKPLKRTKLTDPHLLEISIFDAHFGKMAWERETNQNYDLGIAEAIFESAVEELLQKSNSFQIEKILLPLGQDFFHIDNPTKTTINGTPQDVDTRYAKLFETGTMACVKAVDRLLQVAPVEVIYVPGNHDRTAAWHLVTNLSAWYRNSDEVKVDSRPTLRKYFKYGVNLIGFTHGDEEPHRDLPTIMASEVPQDWADTKFREWHLGHFHKKKEMSFTTADSYGPVLTRILPSISASDAWHYMKGYISLRRAAEAYLWNSTTGYSGHFSANIIS